jgi:hypothetical protein
MICRCRLSLGYPASGLTLPDPAQPLFGRLGRRLMLTVAPRTAAALLVPLRAAAPADHGSVGPGQAALARRIRRRRSDERSSSFRPPQVPYFSGRLIA